jgi:transcriptional regulator with XRE-family HTH domain/tetratricopeptide (TPR) repeat protein
VPEFWSPTLWDAAHRGDYAMVLRLARARHRWTQAEVGARFGCSASTVSRYETGERKLTDVPMLRRLADILGLPAEAFGLTPEWARPASPGAARRDPRVSGDRMPEEVNGTMRRRAFLLVAGLAGTTVTGTLAAGAGIETDPAAFLARRLQSLLFDTPAAGAVGSPSPAAVRSLLLTAGADFRSCDYVSLATRLPEVVTTAQVLSDTSTDPPASVVLAQAYNLVTRALIKLDASGLEWISADRALRAAHYGGDALTMAEAHRLMGSVCRRAGHHDRAVVLTMQAADQLDLSGPRPSATHLARYGLLMCSAAYAYARAGDRDRSLDLLTEAAGTADRLDHDPREQRALAANVLSHRVSAEYVLGNAGIALHHARQATPASFPDTERRARFLVDVALSLAQFDKPAQAYRTLLAAEHAAPGEVRTRATVRRLVGDLMAHRNQAALSGLRDLAARTHVRA